jgi:hypothetical protein
LEDALKLKYGIPKTREDNFITECNRIPYERKYKRDEWDTGNNNKISAILETDEDMEYLVENNVVRCKNIYSKILTIKDESTYRLAYDCSFKIENEILNKYESEKLNKLGDL